MPKPRPVSSAHVDEKHLPAIGPRRPDPRMLRHVRRRAQGAEERSQRRAWLVTYRGSGGVALPRHNGTLAAPSRGNEQYGVASRARSRRKRAIHGRKGQSRYLTSRVELSSFDDASAGKPNNQGVMPQQLYPGVLQDTRWPAGGRRRRLRPSWVVAGDAHTIPSGYA